MHKYIPIEVIGGGGIEYFVKCQHKETGEIVALKTYKNNHTNDGKKLVKLLRKCKHPNIMAISHVFKKGKSKKLCIGFEYIPHRLLDVITNIYPKGLPEDYIKLLIYQIISGIRYLHSQEVMHRDMKPEKILLLDDMVTVKLGGFGLARKISSKNEHTPHVTTSWYRSPEVIFESNYGNGIDMWSIGCVMAELIDSKPLFPGENELTVLYLQQQICANFSEKQRHYTKDSRFSTTHFQIPNQSIITNIDKRFSNRVSREAIDLLKSLLQADPQKRITAEEALMHPFFQDLQLETLMKNYSRFKQPSRKQNRKPTNTNTKPQGQVVPKNSKPTPSTKSTRSKRRYPVRVTSSYKIQIGTTHNHISVWFHKTCRIKASDKQKYRSKSYGILPIHRVDDYIDSVPSSWKKQGGIFIPIYQSEAVQIQIEVKSREKLPKAIKLGIGAINAISGDGWNRDSNDPKDNLFMQPEQTVVIKGVHNSENGDIHPFTPSPLGEDHSTTLQVVMYDSIKPKPGKSSRLPSLSSQSTSSRSNSRVRRRLKGLARYEILNTANEGVYGVVLKCRDKETGQIVAIKRMKCSQWDDEYVRKTTEREKKILSMLSQRNIVQLKETFKKKGVMYFVFEYVHQNMLEKLEEAEHKNGFPSHLVKGYMYQILKALEFCHLNDIIHRDVKLENILISMDNCIKLCDFGFARIVSKNNTQSSYVSTRWYRAPELLVKAEYSKPVDIWAAGCLMAEILDGSPLFPGRTDLDQLYLSQKAKGTLPQQFVDCFYRKFSKDKEAFPECFEKENFRQRYHAYLDETGIDFLESMLCISPEDRLTASELLSHPYFDDFELDAFLSPFQTSKAKPTVDSESDAMTENLPQLLNTWNKGTYQDHLSMKPPKPMAIMEMISRSPPRNAKPSTSTKKKRTRTPKTPARQSRLKNRVKPKKVVDDVRSNKRRDSLSPSKASRRSSINSTETSSRSSSRQSSRGGSRKSKRKKAPVVVEQEMTDHYQIDFSKFGRFYVHLVNVQQYQQITGFEPNVAPIVQANYQEEGIPWYEEYSENYTL